MVEINDMVRFIGVIKTTGFTPISLFRYLLKGEIYKVESVMCRNEDSNYYYTIRNTDGRRYSYPVENFEQVCTREYISNKYDLK